MSKPTSAQIEAAFQDAWEEFGDDKSTEFLISIVSDRMGVSYDRVVDALADVHGSNPEAA